MTNPEWMDAKCIHGNIWWECATCGEEIGELLTKEYIEGIDKEG